MPYSSFIPVDSNILPDIRTGTPAVMYGSKVVVAGIGGNYIPNQLSGVVTSDGNIHNNNVLSGYIGYNSAGRVVGAIPVISGGTHYVDSTGYTLSSGYYLSGDQVFIGTGSGGGLDIDITLGVAVDGGTAGVLFQQLSFSGTSASDHGSAIDVASSYRTWNTGHPAPQPFTSDGNITSDTVLSGYIGYNSQGKVTGAIPSISGGSYTVGSQGYTLSAGQYLAGDQVFTASAGGSGEGTFQGTGRVLISSGAALDGLSITGPSCHVVTYEGGTANNVTVNSGAFLHASSGGTFTDTTVNSSGNMYVSNGGTAVHTILQAGARMIISSAGIADYISCYSNQDLTVMPGGTATNIIYL